MARKSRWQQFADNFNAMYNTVTDVGQEFETAKVMKQDFKDADGNPLTGTALDRARAEALSSIYTKYGDPERGVGLRADAISLDNATMQNEILSRTKEDQIALSGLAVNARKAQIARTNRVGRGGSGGSGGSRAKPSTLTERDALLIQDAISYATGQGVPSTAPAAAPTGYNDAPTAPRAAPTGAGLGAGPAPGTVPTVDQTSSLAPNEDVRVAAANTPEMFVSTRGLSDPGKVGNTDVVSEQPAPGAAPASPDAMTSVPQGFSMELVNNAASEAAVKGVVSAKTIKPAVEQRREGAEIDLQKAVEYLVGQGRTELAKDLVDGVELIGSLETQQILRESERMVGTMNNAIDQYGSAGGIAVLDEFNGDDRHVREVQTESGGWAAVEFSLDAEGKAVDVRPLFEAPDKETLTHMIRSSVQDPETRIDYMTNVYQMQTARAEAELAKAKIPGGSLEERIINALAADPNNPRWQVLAKLKLGMQDEEIAAFGENVQSYNAQKKILEDARAAAGGGSAPKPTPAPAETSQANTPDPTPAEPPAEAPVATPPAAGLKTEGGMNLTGRTSADAYESQQQRARQQAAARAAGLAWQKARAAGQPSGLASNPANADTSPAAIAAQVYQMLVRNPITQGMTDQEIRRLAQDAVSTPAN